MTITISQQLNNLSWPPMFIEKLGEISLDKFKCAYCKNILVNVHQADDCGCRFCFECFEKMHKNKIKKCPSCHFCFASTVRNTLHIRFQNITLCLIIIFYSI